MATALLIDNDPDQRAAVHGTLLAAGLTVVAEACPDELLDRARGLRPNLVVLSLRLPGVDIPSLCRSLSTERGITQLAIVVVTQGRAAPDRAEESARVEAALAAGAADVLAGDEIPAVAVTRIRRLVHFQQLTAMAILNEQLAQVGRLVAGIVHEIRAPLTVIRGNAELMELEIGPDHAAAVWIRPILRNALTLQTRLEHLMAAVRTGPSRPRSVDVVAVVRESISLFEKGIDNRRGRLSIPLVLAAESGPIPLALVDPGRLMQVILNLLANAHDAITAVRPDGLIEVEVNARPDTGEVQIEVHDDGPGVAPEVIERIFEPFFTTKATGTGYGLYLAAEILREHGGRLTACNPTHGGACFSIHLPIAPAAPAPLTKLDGSC